MYVGLTEGNLLLKARTELEYGEGEGNFDVVIVNDELKASYGIMRQFLLERYSGQLQ